MKRLIQFEDGKIIRQIPLKKEKYTLGRESSNDIVFEVSKVSRHHATLVREGESYYVVDNKSANHVYVNGEQITKKLLKSGDTVGLSRMVSLLYLSESEAIEKIDQVLNRMWEAINKKDFMRLKEVTNRMISLDSLKNILGIILDEVIRLVSAERGFIALVDSEGEIKFENAVSFNMPLVDDRMNDSGFSHSIVRQAVQSRKNVTIFSSNGKDDGDFSSSMLLLDLRSVMCSPIIFNENLLGILYVDARYELTDFSEIDQFFFSILADHAAIAIENAKLYDRVKMSNVKLREEVEESEERYRQLVELSPDAIVVHCKGNIVFANRRAVELFGAEKSEDIIGKDYLQRIHPDCQELVAERIKIELEEGRTIPFTEETIVKLDGTPVDVEAAAAPLSYQGLPAVQVVIRDITLRRKIEEEILKIQKLESLGVLAGGIAHDFNNVLTAIIGNISLAKLGVDENDGIFGYLKGAENASFRAKGMAQQLLTFAKGGMPVKKITYLKDLVKDSANFALMGSNIKCKYDLEHDLWPVEADESQITRVLNNLVLNSQQAMPDGGFVEISAANIKVDSADMLPLAPGKYVKINIKDHGIGIPEKILPKIFDPYFTTKQKGSGIGLAVCYSIIKKHNGYITVESEVGKGSAFHFYLPAVPEKAPSPEIIKDSHIVGKGRVLLMDDEEIIRTVAARMLTFIGYEFDMAKDGLEAVNMYKSSMERGNPYAAVILDLTIPAGVGGKETMNRLMKIDPDVKGIVSSGYSNDPIMAEYKEYGFCGFLPKPYKIDELRSVLGEVINQK
ncbi:MAG: PAS domain S-box protein [Firmicutes bacterium]|nr:PAS domain S-box protein [Bacillota bacterium]